MTWRPNAFRAFGVFIKHFNMTNFLTLEFADEFNVSRGMYLFTYTYLCKYL